MKNIIVRSFVFLIHFLFSIVIYGQTQANPPLATPQRAAEGETKWMMSQLKFDKGIYPSVFDINLKYRVKSDSVHSLQNTSIIEKKKLYQQFTKNKNEELKMVLSREIYAQYISLLQAVKSNVQR